MRVKGFNAVIQSIDRTLILISFIYYNFYFRTKLEVRDTEEYRRREERASAIAAEIEETPTYKKHIALENGEGDMDEETRFSAVVRVTEQNNNTQQSPFVQSTGGPGK